LIVALATDIQVENLKASTGIEDACLLALEPHRKAVEQNALFTQVLALLGTEIRRREPAPSRIGNELAAKMAMDELIHINGCRWLHPEAYIAPLDAKLADAAAGALQLVELAIWLETQVAS
jgi:hypothetical protein